MKKTTLSHAFGRALLDELGVANPVLAQQAEGVKRQPVHTIYGGAQLFKSSTPQKLGEIARQTFEQYATSPAELAQALGNPYPKQSEKLIYDRVLAKLKSEPIEDLRVDFEDGYGIRSEEDEDTHAVAAAEQMAIAHQAKALPCFIGVRIKPLTPESGARALRTLDLFLTTFVAKLKPGELPNPFIVTLPKVSSKEQVKALADCLSELEKQLKVPEGFFKIELMIETPEAIFGRDGQIALPGFVAQAQGRCIGAHFGTYDYTASCNIIASHQRMQHPACDFAKHVMQLALAGTSVVAVDGATTLLPIPPHRKSSTSSSEDKAGLTEKQMAENKALIYKAWQTSYANIQHSLKGGFYQGWDLHPAQIPVRYSAMYAFFLDSLEDSAVRLKEFVQKSAQANQIGGVFDDAATGRGLLNYFSLGLSCGALTEDDLGKTGLTLEQLGLGSFKRILGGR